MAGALKDLVRSYLDLRWHLDPVSATQAGVRAYDDRYGRYGPETLVPHLAAFRALAAALEESTGPTLDEEIDRTALLNDIRVTVSRFEKERPQTKNPQFWLEHAFGGLYYLLARRDRPTAHRAASLLSRLEDLPRFLEDARSALTEPVRIFVATALDVIAAGRELVRLAAEAAGQTVAADRVDAVRAGAEAALESFTRDLKAWQAKASDGFAVGVEQFDYRLHYEYALNDTAPMLWRYGKSLEEEIERDLAGRAKRFDSGRPWAEIIHRLRENHPPADQLVAVYKGAMERARQFVIDRKLAAVPAEPLEVIPTPEFLRPMVPFAAYDAPGPYSSDRTGWFYVTPPDPKLPPEARDRILSDHCEYEVGATALHEGYPGHHLQIATAQAQPSEVRRILWTPLTGEGWALYCEDMMAEEGFYRTEEDRLFQRLHLLWRAVRIVVDVGLHTRGMTYEEAVEYMVTRLAIGRANAEAEVRRYCATPTYQLCYAVGRRELLSLRDAYKRAKGSAFSLSGFHSDVLRFGAMPVALIRWGLGLGG
jgi:uncharacterized protein (DUF885 family)